MCSLVGDRGGTGNEVEGRNEHLVPALHAGQQQGEVECGRSTGEGHGVSDARPLGYFAFEGVDVRPDRCDPVGVERLEQHPSFLGSDVGWGQEDARHGRVPEGLFMPPASAAPPRSAAATTTSIPRATAIEAWPTITTTATATATTTSTAM